MLVAEVVVSPVLVYLQRYKEEVNPPAKPAPSRVTALAALATTVTAARAEEARAGAGADPFSPWTSLFSGARPVTGKNLRTTLKDASGSEHAIIISDSARSHTGFNVKVPTYLCVPPPPRTLTHSQGYSLALLTWGHCV
jgi:hypothetical protein